VRDCLSPVYEQAARGGGFILRMSDLATFRAPEPARFPRWNLQEET
jgi:hypothetical protein